MGTQKDQQLSITPFGRFASGKEEKQVCPLQFFCRPVAIDDNANI